ARFLALNPIELDGLAGDRQMLAGALEPPDLRGGERVRSGDTRRRHDTQDTPANRQRHTHEGTDPELRQQARIESGLILDIVDHHRLAVRELLDDWLARAKLHGLGLR